MELKRNQEGNESWGKFQGNFTRKGNPWAMSSNFPCSVWPPHPFFFLSQRLDGRGQATKYFNLSCYSRQNKTENRAQYALTPSRLVCCIFLFMESKKNVLHQELATTSIQKLWIRLPENQAHSLTIPLPVFRHSVRKWMVSFLPDVKWAGGKFPSTFFSWLCSQSVGRQMFQSLSKVIWIYVLVLSLILWASLLSWLLH